jgi:hypothetical protein
MAAGRFTSSEAISTFLPSRSFRRLAILAVVVVLPPPCRPTIRTGAGGLSILSAPGSSSPVSTWTSSSWTILMTCWPGVTDFVTAAPVAFFSTALMNWRATGSETSASSSATRTSRMAVRTSSSLSAPCLVSRSKTPPRRSERFSNMGRCPLCRLDCSQRREPTGDAPQPVVQTAFAPVGETSLTGGRSCDAAGPEGWRNPVFVAGHTRGHGTESSREWFQGRGGGPGAPKGRSSCRSRSGPTRPRPACPAPSAPAAKRTGGGRAGPTPPAWSAATPPGARRDVHRA